ncbi:MAG: hypothetical protein LBB61_06545, partial [Treponema sp.]|nr:hypothetical protein [Treponema sp.]
DDEDDKDKIPSELVETWGNGSAELFTINSDASGTLGNMNGTWSVSDSTPTFTATNGSGSVQWEIKGGKLAISNPSGALSLLWTVIVQQPPLDKISGGGNDIPAVTNVQVYDEDGKEYTGGGTVKIKFGDNDTREPLGCVAAGTITGGKPTLNLPSSIPDNYLSDMDTAPAGITVTPSGVKGGGGSGNLAVFAGGNEIGSIDYTNNSGDTISYMYVTKAVAMTGIYNGEYTAPYNAPLKAG